MNAGYFKNDLPVNHLPSDEVEELKLDDRNIFVGHPGTFSLYASQ